MTGGYSGLPPVSSMQGASGSTSVSKLGWEQVDGRACDHSSLQPSPVGVHMLSFIYLVKKRQRVALPARKVKHTVQR